MVKSLMGLLPRQRLPEFGSFRDASGMGLLHLAVRLGSMGVLATLLKNCSAPVWQVSVGSLTHLPTHPLIHSFVCLFIHSFIQLFSLKFAC